MYVRRLELTDFRSYRSARVDFDPGPSVLVGPNGVGKTNLVEAIGYVATLASHRVAADAPLVRVGAVAAVVRCAIVHEHRELLVELSIEPGRANRVRLGSSPLRRARDVLGALRLVAFAPEDLSLVRGDPAERRRYLDDLLVARQPRFAGVRSDYDRVLRQRNALLRTAYLARKAGGSRTDLSTLDVWDAHLARHGAELLAARMALVTALGSQVAKAYDAVSAGRATATLVYRSTTGDGPGSGGMTGDGPGSGPEPGGPGGPETGVGPGAAGGVPAALRDGDVAAARAELEKRLLAALAEARPAEVDRGVTLVGPHRDDLLLSLGGMPARGYASHGESWSLALALRLAGYELLRAEGVEPVLVLDDVFAELDAGRRERLAELVGGAAQVLVTCAVEADVPATLRGARYEVSEGGVRRV